MGIISRGDKPSAICNMRHITFKWTTHPVLVRADQRLHSRDKLCLRHGRHTEPQGPRLDPLGILIGPEQDDATLDGLLSLHALKRSLTIVEHLGTGHDGDGTVRLDCALIPSLLCCPCGDVHILQTAENWSDSCAWMDIGFPATLVLPLQHPEARTPENPSRRLPWSCEVSMQLNLSCLSCI